jgi:hypothetical protein
MPSSTALESALATTVGTAELGKRVQGQVPGTDVVVAVGVAVGGPRVGVVVGVGVRVLVEVGVPVGTWAEVLNTTSTQ